MPPMALGMCSTRRLILLHIPIRGRDRVRSGDMMAVQSCLLSVAARRGYFRDIMMVVLKPKIVSCLERKLTCRR